MDAGGDRPFEERAVLFDIAGEYFCRETLNISLYS